MLDEPAPIPVSLIGHGTVGRGVVRLLGDPDGDLRRRAGLRFEPVAVAVRDPAKHREIAAGLPITADARAAATHPDARVVLELAGGVEEAGRLVLAALDAGKHVVTANKALLAARGPELFAAARRNGVALAFEASCGGGIPIVGALLNGLLADRLHAVVGILNGTSNQILTSMTDAGATYADALKDAQDKGFAEADPTLDVGGGDAAQKLAILAGLAFGEQVDAAAVHVEGIDGLDARDIAYAGDLGYVVKLLAVARRDDDGRLALSVFPGLLPTSDPMADVKGPFNAVATYGDALGRAMFVGRGAGGMPTAAAVVADLLSVATGAYPALFSQLRTFADVARPADVIDFGRATHRYYLRLTARDAPGVLADVTRHLGDAGISLSAVLQRERSGDGGGVPVVITTHVAREASVRRAVAAIDRLPGVVSPTAVLRIVDMPRESTPTT